MSQVTWCHECELEHLSWAAACARCGGELHPEPPPAPVPAGEVPHELVQIDLSGMEPSARELFLLFLDGADIRHSLSGLLLSIAESDEQRTRELLETITADTLVELDPAQPADDTQWSRDMAAMMHPSAMPPPERLGTGDEDGDGRPAPAGVVRRLAGAFLTDLTWALVIVVVADPLSGVWPGVEDDLPRFLLSGLAPMLADVALVARWGRTPGMAALSCRVVGPDGRPPGWASSAVRMVVFAWPTLLMWATTPFDGIDGVTQAIALIWWIGLLISIATDPERRGWHDRVAGTSVVMAPWQRLVRR
jgi:uncharacterized RDD family membrane protein YckC